MKLINVCLLFLCTLHPSATFSKNPFIHMAAFFQPAAVSAAKDTNHAFAQCFAALNAQEKGTTKYENALRLHTEYTKSCKILQQVIESSLEQDRKKLFYYWLVSLGGLSMHHLGDDAALLGAIIAVPSGILALHTFVKSLIEEKALFDLKRQRVTNLEMLYRLKNRSF